jgi:hypothetical protein
MSAERLTKTHPTSAAKKGKGRAFDWRNSISLNHVFESDYRPRPKRNCAPQSFTPEPPIDPRFGKLVNPEKDPDWRPAGNFNDLSYDYEEGNTKTTKEFTPFHTSSRNRSTISSGPLTRPTDAANLVSLFDSANRKRKHSGGGAEAITISKKRQASGLTGDKHFDSRRSTLRNDKLEATTVRVCHFCSIY